MVEKRIKITEAQINSLRTSLIIFNRVIDEIELICESGNKIGVLYEDINDLSGQERELVKKKIREIRKYINYLKNKLNLLKEKKSVRNNIASRFGSLWEMVCELESKRLSAYGKVDDTLKEVTDPVVKKIIKLVNETTDILTKRIIDK